MNPIHPTLRNGHRIVTAYYEVDKVAFHSWNTKCKKNVSDWEALAEHVKRAQSLGYRDVMYSDLDCAYQIASQNFKQIEILKDASYLDHLRASIKEKKLYGLRTAGYAYTQAIQAKCSWAFIAGYYHGVGMPGNEKTEAGNQKLITQEFTVGKVKNEIKDLANAKPCNKNVEVRPKHTTRERSVSGGKSKNSRAGSKSNTNGGYAMAREKKRYAVEGRGVKAVAPLRVNPQPLLFGNEPLSKVPENAIADTDSEDGWDPACFIEPVKKRYRH